jgi:hypothetical protein
MIEGRAYAKGSHCSSGILVREAGRMRTRAYAFQDLQRFRMGNVAKDNAEFVAPITTNRAVHPGAKAHDVGDFLQDAIAGDMTQLVINFLESINIDYRDHVTRYVYDLVGYELFHNFIER